MSEEIICPYCATTMVQGQWEVRGSLLGLMLIGLSYQSLRFTPGHGGRSEVVMKPHAVRPGFKCPECKAIVMQGRSAVTREADVPYMLTVDD